MIFLYTRYYNLIEQVEESHFRHSQLHAFLSGLSTLFTLSYSYRQALIQLSTVYKSHAQKNVASKKYRGSTQLLALAAIISAVYTELIYPSVM